MLTVHVVVVAGSVVVQFLIRFWVIHTRLKHFSSEVAKRPPSMPRVDVLATNLADKAQRCAE
jgi:hypothetical protein